MATEENGGKLDLVTFEGGIKKKPRVRIQNVSFAAASLSYLLRGLSPERKSKEGYYNTETVFLIPVFWSKYVWNLESMERLWKWWAAPVFLGISSFSVEQLSLVHSGLTFENWMILKLNFLTKRGKILQRQRLNALVIE